MNSPPSPQKKPNDFHTPSIYDKRTRQYRKPYIFPNNQTKWWLKHKHNHVVRAVVNRALTINKAFTGQDIYETARFINGNLVKNSGSISPTREKVEAMIRYSGYFKSKRIKRDGDMKYRTVWRRK